jgi:superfamily II DNA/RNA helicase
MPETISDLANSILKDPVQIEVTPVSSTVDRIEQKIHFVDKNHKTLLLKKIIKQEEVTSVLVFSKTKHGANRVVEYLSQQAISVAAIHGNKSQGAREKALSQFRAGEIKVLVATDIAARGIDIPGISHVINFDIPMDPESYVHRIGRTARAGREGVAISFCDPSERRLLQAVEKLINFKVPVDDTHPYHGVESVAEREDSFDAPRRRQPQRSAPQRRESSGGYDSRRPRGGEFSDSRKPAGARTRSSSSEGNQSRSRFKSDSDAPRDRNFSSRSSDSFSKSRKTDSAKSSFGGLKKKPHFGSDSARSSFGDSDSRPRFSSFDKRKSDVEFGNRAPRNTERDDNFGNTERGSLSRRKSEDGGFGFTERRKPFGFGGRSAGFGQRTDSRTGQRSDSRSDRPFGAKRSESGFGQRTEGNFARKSSGGFGNSSGGGFGARSSRPSSGGFGKKRPSSNSGGNWKGNR